MRPWRMICASAARPRRPQCLVFAQAVSPWSGHILAADVDMTFFDTIDPLVERVPGSLLFFRGFLKSIQLSQRLKSAEVQEAAVGLWCS